MSAPDAPIKTQAERKAEANAALENIKDTRRENQNALFRKQRRVGFLSILGGSAIGAPADVTGGPQPAGGGASNVAVPRPIAGAMARY